ncbi:sarcosine oxidase subunit gamma [Spirillospora sp. CA-128828]|uniref:sarcosine oxidase subunit gamma n=1 Tax=Spirillospora sp. CA-128828 TaxID=3240033 RepID=UPI003D926826
MAEGRAPRSAVAHLAPDFPDRPGGAVRLREVAFPAQIELRLDDEEAGSFGPRAGRLLRCDIPARGHVTGVGDPCVLWLGPGRYLVMDRPGSAHGLLTGLEDALGADGGGIRGSAVDVSAARTVLDLSGPSARAVLAHGCPLDLHPSRFGPGRCAQTVLAQAQVVLHQTGATDYRILVRASYADYLARWFLDAMTEYV